MSGSNDERRHALVPAEGDGKRLDRFLVEVYPRYSRSRITAVIRSGAVRVNGARARPGQLLVRGDRLEIPVFSTAVAEVERRVWQKGVRRRGAAAPREVVELYRDDDLLVVSKPPGVPVHGGARLSDTVTLLDLMKSDILDGFGLVHRLDKDTSGAIALVRGEDLRAQASKDFADPEADIEKVYEALVDGAPHPVTGQIELPLTPPDRRGIVRVDERSGRPCCTRYATVETYPEASRLRLELLTGRTHQIRAHLAAIGHPLLVDPRYGDRGGWKLVDPRGQLDAVLRRTPLHASRLRLPHPRTRQPVEVEAPMAPDIRYALEVLRVDAGHRRARPEEGGPRPSGDG